jgi:hypothetical protein
LPAASFGEDIRHDRLVGHDLERVEETRRETSVVRRQQGLRRVGQVVAVSRPADAMALELPDHEADSFEAAKAGQGGAAADAEFGG